MTMLKLFISEEFNGTIWRLEIDELSETIFIEIRNEQEKQVSFAAINLTSGKIFFKNLTTSERWLTGIEAAYNGVLLLHNYQSENGPLHKGLIAVDGITGEILWSNYIYAFDHLTINGPVVYDTHIQPKRLLLIDIKNGATIGPYNPSIHKELKNNIIVPQLISPDFLPPSFLPSTPFGNSVHYLEYNNFRIVSLHTLQAGALEQYLYVMDGPDKVYEDLLNTNIQKLQPEAFILRKSRLVYIKNKSALKILNL